MKPLISNATFRRPVLPINRTIGGSATELPADFVRLIESLADNCDRQLGYFGAGRFVAFRYEPRAEDVIWEDERSFGIGTGAWQAFFDEVQPLADLYSVNVGNSGAAAGRPDHVLVFDRVGHTAYFAPRSSAEDFLARRREILPQAG